MIDHLSYSSSYTYLTCPRAWKCAPGNCEFWEECRG